MKETIEGNLKEVMLCPLCGLSMESVAGLASCTNTLCPNHKGMAA